MEEEPGERNQNMAGVSEFVDNSDSEDDESESQDKESPDTGDTAMEEEQPVVLRAEDLVDDQGNWSDDMEEDESSEDGTSDQGIADEIDDPERKHEDKASAAHPSSGKNRKLSQSQVVDLLHESKSIVSAEMLMSLNTDQRLHLPSVQTGTDERAP